MQITWPPYLIAPLLDRDMDYGYRSQDSQPSRRLAAFSGTREGSQNFFPMIRGWIEGDIPHGSVVMLPSGECSGRPIRSNGTLEPMA